MDDVLRGLVMEIPHSVSHLSSVVNEDMGMETALSSLQQLTQRPAVSILHD